MRLTINRRITLYLIIFSLVIIGLIALVTKYMLPQYYKNYQLQIIEDYYGLIDESYDEEDPNEAIDYMETLRSKVGGELYEESEQGLSQGYGKGKNAQSQRKNSEKFIPDEKVTAYTYLNKVGLEIYVIGIEVDETYLVYEVNIQSLDDAVHVIMNFLWMIMLFVLVLAVGMATVISNSISMPVRNLNMLAKSMMSKKVEAVMVTRHKDELGELNHSLNELYEELLSSIYHLESELLKERNSEALKKRFLAQATHELKTPIAIVRGYSEILYDGMYKNEDDRDRYIKNIYDETESITHLILDVLEYTKMETGNYKLEMRQVNGLTTFKPMVQRLKTYIVSHNLECEAIIDLDKDQWMTIDSGRIEQVIKNLVSNGVEHAKSYVNISIVGNGDAIKIQVVNDGSQIDQEDLPYIFDSFYKKKGKQTGTGLGLAITKEIVLLHGGDYRAMNFDQGVKFIVTI